MRYAAARMLNTRARFFSGSYVPRESLPLPAPATTGRPDCARTYDDQVVAQAVVDYLNLIDLIETGARKRPWIVMPLPEAWTS